MLARRSRAASSTIAAPGVGRDLARRGEGMQAAQERQLTGVDVADAGRDGLVEQDVHQGPGPPAVMAMVAAIGVQVDVRQAEIRAQPAQRGVAPHGRFIQQFHDRCVEADGTDLVVRQHDPDPAARSYRS
jgi:hypothetical protein